MAVTDSRCGGTEPKLPMALHDICPHRSSTRRGLWPREQKQDVANRNQVELARSCGGRCSWLQACLAGSTSAGELMPQRQGEACRAVGIDYQLLTYPADVTQRELKYEIRRLNANPAVTGIMMHPSDSRPPGRARLQYEIDVVKRCRRRKSRRTSDAHGLPAATRSFAPCTCTQRGSS